MRTRRSVKKGLAAAAVTLGAIGGSVALSSTADAIYYEMCWNGHRTAWLYDSSMNYVGRIEFMQDPC